MGQIQINTPSGPVLVNIAGDTPTEEEQKTILDNIDKISAQVPSSDIPSPEKEDISNYYRRLRALQAEQAEEAPTEEVPE